MKTSTPGARLYFSVCSLCLFARNKTNIVFSLFILPITCLQNNPIWLQEKTLTLSPLWSTLQISEYLIASCYVNDARLKYQLWQELCATVLMYPLLSGFFFFFFLHHVIQFKSNLSEYSWFAKFDRVSVDIKCSFSTHWSVAWSWLIPLCLYSQTGSGDRLNWCWQEDVTCRSHMTSDEFEPELI